MFPMFGGGGGGVNTGPSPSFMQRFRQNMPYALNSAAQNYGDPNSQQIAKKTARVMPPRPNRGTSRSGVPVNSPMGQTPASSITDTGNAAPNPYSSDSGMGGGMPNIVRGPSMPMFGSNMIPGQMSSGFLPQRSSMQMPGMTGGGSNFWQMYNQMGGSSPLGNRQIFT